MKKIFALIISSFVLQINSYAQSTKANFSIGIIDTIHSKVLNEKRIINVYLPEGYDPKDTIKYPVIYLLDGNKDEDFIHVAGLIQYLSFPWINQTKPSIVIGIANVDRRRDFTYPTTVAKDKQDFPTTGSSEKFISFIESELQPYISSNFKITPSKTIIGQSLGGLLATEILFKKPHLFNNYVIVSPSLWWDSESLLKFKPDFSSQSKLNIHISVGKEGDVMIRDAKALLKKLQAIEKGKPKTTFRYYGDMDHASIYHIALYNALTWLNKQ
ncbi:MAG: alpha/beta hydrolase [Bacteroidia bacterium]|nr:alpha/beta hydrolase [Bacteroidia bacterium]